MITSKDTTRRTEDRIRQLRQMAGHHEDIKYEQAARELEAALEEDRLDSIRNSY